MGIAITLVNAVAVHRMGLAIADWGSVLLDSLAVASAAFLVGHVGRVLEKALGARAETALAYDELEAAARDRMLSITDQVPIGLYRSTPDGKIIGGNDALMTMLGFPDREAMMAADVWDFYVDAKDRSAKMDTSVEGRGVWTELDLKRADGTPIRVRDWAAAVLDDDGAPLYFDGVIEDITESRLVNELFRAAFEDSPYGMALSTGDGYLVRGNKALAELLDRPHDSLVDLHFSKFTFEDEMDVTPEAVAKARAGEVVRYEKRLARPDGSFLWALVSLAPIRVAGDHSELFISHVIDITERQRVREGLENLVRSKDELIASVSHELRTPLTVVHGLSQELDTNWMSFSVPEQKEFIGMIAQQSAEVAHIVEDLLVAARADIGRLPINPTKVDLRDEVEAARDSVPNLDIGLEFVGGAAPVAFADPSRVRQIVRNLLVNAVRYGGPVVEAKYGVEGESVWLDVRDNGSGVPPAEVAKIFEPYERAHDAAGQPMSVGLGLTVSRTLAEMMGGRLEYRYEGSWSVFRLELPASGSIPLAPGGAASHSR